MSDQIKEFNVFACDLSGRHLIEASAGTGKTYTITSIYLRLLLETDLLPSDILVVTFTDAATAELKQRIRTRIRESINSISEGRVSGRDDFLSQLVDRYDKEDADVLIDKLNKFDEASIYTIHGFCNRLLTENNILFDVSADFEMLTDDNQLLQDAVDQFWRDFIGNDLNKPKKALIDLLSNKGIGPDELKNRLKKLLSRPYAEVIPSALDLKEFEKDFAELQDLFSKIQKVYEVENEILKQFFFGDSLRGNVYHANKKEEYWTYFEEWVCSKEAAISYFGQLEKFGLKMPSSIKKNETAPDLKIFRLVDEFIEESDSLKEVVFEFISLAYDKTKSILERRKAKQGVITYDDLLQNVWSGVTGTGSERLKKLIVSNYPVALVDEFQDTDPIQYEIFDSIYSNEQESCLFMIGDPKQSIYGFRGADIYTYVEARNSLRKNNTYSLNYNYRSNSGLLESFNKLFTLKEDPFLLSSLRYQKVLPPASSDTPGLFQNGESVQEMNFIRLVADKPMNKGDATSEVSDAVVKTIIHLLNEKSGFTIGNESIREKDIAILVRNRFQGQQLQDMLRREGVFSVLRSKDSVYDSNEAGDLLIVLTALTDLEYEPYVKSALTTDLIGMSFHEINELMGNSDNWNKIYQDLIEVKKGWFGTGISKAIQMLESLFSIQKTLGKSGHAHRRLTNFRHLKELLVLMEKESGLDPSALLKSFSNKVNDPANTEGEEIRLENDEDLIQILTIHASKGLEFPIVFNPFLWTTDKTPNDGDGIIYLHKNKKKYLDLRKKGISADRKNNELIAYRNSISESVRLMYVALTRAKYACYIFLPDYNDVYLSPLGVIVQDQDILDMNLADKINSVKSDKISSETIADKYSDTFHFLNIEEVTQSVPRNIDNQDDIEIIKAQSYDRVAPNINKKLISYSWLSRQSGEHNDQSFKDFDLMHSLAAVTQTTDLTPFTFPKGAHAGSFLHDIFENIDFTDPSSHRDVIEEKILQYGYEIKWVNTILKWISKCIDVSLDGSDLSLRNIGSSDIIKEMEFHFPIYKLDLDKINKIMRHNDLNAIRESISGYMKGYIDLIFRWKGRFYIADYKSNYLGDSYSEYENDALDYSISSSQYDLQYYMYTLALNKYLSTRISGYDYEKHFGGVYYLYLRGMRRGESTGIYFDRPDIEKVQKLSDILGK